jgi:hypothetical protein
MVSLRTDNKVRVFSWYFLFQSLRNVHGKNKNMLSMRNISKGSEKKVITIIASRINYNYSNQDYQSVKLLCYNLGIFTSVNATISYKNIQV